MKTMNMPGFTAEASLYRGAMSYQTVANFRDSRLLLMPALGKGVQTGGKSCSARCADAANNCTSGCRPEDSACRDDCDSAFWCCLTGCGIGAGVPGTVVAF
jgi:hypothetical protein